MSFNCTQDCSPFPGELGTRGYTSSTSSRLFILSSRCLLLWLLCTQGCGLQTGALPPGQPASGPGGSDYLHDSVVALRTGIGPGEFWVFTPNDPIPYQAPFVVFLHGWGAVHPRAYGAWIQHIVRKGHIVVYPRYQNEDQFRTAGDVMLAGAGQALQEAWSLLNDTGPVTPLQDRVVYIGHSMGGLLAAKIAANADPLGLPPAGALFIVQPGGQETIPIGDLSGVPQDAIVAIMTGDKDTIAGSAGARAIYASLTRHAGRRVELIRMQSERRSQPELIANHFAPLAVADGFPPRPIIGGDANVPGGWLQDRLRELRQNRYEVDALDYFGFWKIGDALLDATFRGENLEYGYGNTLEQQFMGTLSNGTHVSPLVIE